MAGNELVQSLTRGLMILEHVARSSDGATIQEIAAMLDVKPPTAHNLVRTLAERGYVARREGPIRYVLGQGVLELAEGARGGALRRRAERSLLEVAERKAGVTATFVQAVGGEMVATLRVSPERPGFVQHPSSQVMSPYTSASGLLYQAFWSDRERSAYRSRYPFAEYGAGEWKTLVRLERFLEDARAAGAIALQDETLCRVAVPVMGAGGEVVAGVGISGQTAGKSPEEFVQLARQAAGEITGITRNGDRDAHVG